jgi:chaperonin GroES
MENQHLEMLNDKVLIRLDRPPEKSKGGIIVLEQHQNPSLKATVLACGPGRWNKDCTRRIALQVKIGDVVIIGAYTGHEVDPDDKTLLICDEPDILGVFEGDAEGSVISSRRL